MKQCTWCKQSKHEDEFYKMPTGKGGLRPECKECTKARNKRDRNASKIDVCACGNTKMKSSAMCVACKKVVTAESFTSKDRHGYMYCVRDGVRIPAHRWVMEQRLGRPLLPGENVHHINGVRDDNRPENLELWVTYQPAGQRPQDLVEWATTILERYGSNP